MQDVRDKQLPYQHLVELPRKQDTPYPEWKARELGMSVILMSRLITISYDIFSFSKFLHYMYYVWTSDECLKINCDHYLSLDADARLTNPNTLRLLIETNKCVIFHLNLF